MSRFLSLFQRDPLARRCDTLASDLRQALRCATLSYERIRLSEAAKALEHARDVLRGVGPDVVPQRVPLSVEPRRLDVHG